MIMFRVDGKLVHTCAQAGGAAAAASLAAFFAAAFALSSSMDACSAAAAVSWCATYASTLSHTWSKEATALGYSRTHPTPASVFNRSVRSNVAERSTRTWMSGAEQPSENDQPSKPASPMMLPRCSRSTVSTEPSGISTTTCREPLQCPAVAARSFRNLTEVQLIAPGELNAYDVLCNDYVVFTQSVLPQGAESATEKDEK